MLHGDAREALWAVAALWLAVYVLGSSCSTYVPPNMIGIRQVYFGSGAGIKPESYWPGLHFTIAGVERLHMFPHDLQIINFSATSSEASSQTPSPTISLRVTDFPHPLSPTSATVCPGNTENETPCTGRICPLSMKLTRRRWASWQPAIPTISMRPRFTPRAR